MSDMIGAAMNLMDQRDEWKAEAGKLKRDRDRLRAELDECRRANARLMESLQECSANAVLDGAATEGKARG